MKNCFRFICKELYLTFKLAFPVYLTFFCLHISSLIPTIFAGQMENGKVTGAAVNLCFAITNITSFFLLSGLSSSLDTLASQAHGAADHKRLGILIQRSMLIHLFLVIPIAIIWINIDNILIILNQQPELVLLARQYMKVYIFIIPANALTFPCMKILQMQNIVIPSAIILACGVGLDIVLCYLFVFVMDMGITGAALGQVLVTYAIVSVHLVYLRMSSVWKRIWGGWSWEAWGKWSQYFYYGAPEMFAIGNEILSVQLGGFVIGMISDQPEVEINVYSILSYLDIIAFFLPLSLSIVASIRIGNLVGEGDIKRVKKVAAFYMTSQVVFSIIQSIILFGGRWIWGVVFSSDPNVVSGVANLIFIITIYHTLDSLAIVFQGILRGIGKQDISFLMAFVFIIVAYPVSIGLSVGLRLFSLGYFLGIMTAYLARAFVCFFIALCYIKWNAFGRVNSQSVQANSPLLRSTQSSELVGSFHSQHSTTHPHPMNDTSQVHPINSVHFSKSTFFPMVTKTAFFFILIALFILLLSCKLGSQRLSFHIEGSYLQQPLEFCCFSYIPIRNISI